ncbi:unnamed protein product, partial [Staurois parvus]
MCTDGHWYVALMGTDKWQLLALTGVTDGATLIIRALMISVDVPSEECCLLSLLSSRIALHVCI